MGYKKFWLKKYFLLKFFLALMALNVFVYFFNFQIDLTQEKRYSLQPSTKAMIKGLEAPLSITIFLEGNLPTGFKKLKNFVDDYFQNLQTLNPTKIAIQFVNLNDTEDKQIALLKDSLVQLGGMPINLTVQKKQTQSAQLIYPYALLNYQGKTTLLELYAGGKRFISATELNNAEALLEYQLAQSVSNLTHPQRPLIAYLTGNGEPTDAKTYDLYQTIQQKFEFFILDLKKQAFIPDTFKVALMVKPANSFSETELFKIDQYLMKGGNLLCFIDNLYAEADSLALQSRLIAFDRNLNLNNLFFKYGARLNTDLVMDLQSDFMPFMVGGTPQNPQFEFLHWNYYPVFGSENNHLINKNIGLVSGKFVNSIDTIKTEGITKTVLLRSSNNARKIATPALISLNENRNTPEDALFKIAQIPVAVLLEGNFNSYFKNRLLQNFKDSLEKYRQNFLEKSQAKGKLILVADGDMVLNELSPEAGPLQMGENLFTKNSKYAYQFSNKTFLLNSLEYLTSQPEIIALRNKEIQLRLLDSQKIQQNLYFWQWINILLPILIILGFGIFYHKLNNRF